MEKESIQNMTRGNPVKLIINFTLPLLAGNIFQQLYNVVDAVIVGRGVGVDALAAVGATGSLNFLIFGFVLGLTQGLSILVSQYYGGMEYNKVCKAITMSAYLYILIGIIISLASVIYSRVLLEILNTPGSIITDADNYMKIIFGGMIITIFFNTLSGILRALGDGKTPFYSLIIASIINIILDLGFILILDMGVKGAALATVIAQFISSIFCLYKVSKIKIIKIQKKHWRFNEELFVQSFKLGIPVALMNSVTAVGVMILQVVVNGFGEIYVAAYSTASRIIGILEQIGSTAGLAISTYTGQNLGAGKIDRIKEGVKKSNVILVIANFILTVIIFVFGKEILAVFVSSAEVEVINIGYKYEVVTAAGLWVLGLLFIYRSSLQAMGDTFIPMLSGIAELLARIGTVFILVSSLDFIAIPIAEVSAWIVAAGMLAATYYYRVFKLEKIKYEDVKYLS
ncbi:putative efflux protein, MATE family [Clostridium sp. DSM 8431]|uniref:MATE family efflux transporter n=1 Tax=Clostridium sp. DSM 8431 TaxID=1761781 RepID=UPI0008E488DF|nr:MATE family efflux transporter [Clostridium sp. DSM 8431]SFU81786.1 putative efflux protein, MATE family [Clostridium sp. DSM 8431]